MNPTDAGPQAPPDPACPSCFELIRYAEVAEKKCERFQKDAVKFHQNAVNADKVVGHLRGKVAELQNELSNRDKVVQSTIEMMKALNREELDKAERQIALLNQEGDTLRRENRELRNALDDTRKQLGTVQDAAATKEKELAESTTIAQTMSDTLARRSGRMMQLVLEAAQEMELLPATTGGCERTARTVRTLLRLIVLFSGSVSRDTSVRSPLTSVRSLCSKRSKAYQQCKSGGRETGEVRASR
jgi:DNA repair exonuclease SbcCD ATPase subunit